MDWSDVDAKTLTDDNDSVVGKFKYDIKSPVEFFYNVSATN